MRIVITDPASLYLLGRITQLNEAMPSGTKLSRSSGVQMARIASLKRLTFALHARVERPLAEAGYDHKKCTPPVPVITHDDVDFEAALEWGLRG